MEYKLNKNNQWAAQLYFIDEGRGPEAIVNKIYAEYLGTKPSVDEVKSCLDEGMGIYTEKALNELIKHFNLVCDQAISGNGYSTFRNKIEMNF